MSFKLDRVKPSFLPLILTFLISNISFSQKIDAQFFSDVDGFLKKHVEYGLIDYQSIKNSNDFNNILSQIENAILNDLDDKSIKAFYINAYNILVIHQIAQHYPIHSVKDIIGFFDKNKFIIAQEKLTLNEVEKKKLLATYHDARLHFVLVCGAKGCPPITNFAYTPILLESQLDQQTRLAINDQNFIKRDKSNIELSEIFKWYASDFGNSKKSILSFINKYKDQKISNSAKIKYYPYDWSLNNILNQNSHSNIIHTPSNQSRYIVSSTIPKGSIETKVFNNLYSQQTGNGIQRTNRSSFFTSSLSILYGVSSRINIGLATRFRKVRNNPLPSSPFSVFGNGDEFSSRLGLTALGPQIRYAPNPKWKNFSIQSSFVLPIGKDLAGNQVLPYIDWNGATWNTQFFNDFSIGAKFSLFTEIDILWEDIGSLSQGHNNRISTPITAIFSYVPTNQLTFYTLTGFSPYWQFEFDYFAQIGVGSKYQFTPNLELELLYTLFSNKFLFENNGRAETINIGFRFNI